MPDRVLQAMHRPAPNIYTGQLVDMVAGLVPDLKAVARTEGPRGDVHRQRPRRMGGRICNTLSRGDRILVLGTGRFCLGWGEMAAAMGVDCQIIDFGQQSDIDMARVAEALAADREHRIKAVMAVQVDTSTSVKNDIAICAARSTRSTTPRSCSPTASPAWPVTSFTWTTGAST
jgi:alanine-glyoxylate transaminase/serine-glyoxylate transaminase/serine-pyruvate transaminase